MSEDAAFIAACPFFFLATADAEGRPDCSFKGGDPGFARVLAPDLLAFPDYDGNGMFKSLGNIRANPAVGLLFMSFEPAAARPEPIPVYAEMSSINPVFLLPLVVVARWRQGRRGAAVSHLAAAAVTWLVLNVPVAVAAPSTASARR